MIGRLLWISILLVIAITTAGLQLDRQARKTPAIAPHVPEVFRSAAQPRVTSLAINQASPAQAIYEAEKLVRRRPMPARHLRLLAQAQFAAGENEASNVTVQFAAQRGWRDSLTQEAMLQIALAVGDRSEAARRYAALFLIRGTDLDVLERYGQAVFAAPKGKERDVFAEIVSGGERWRSLFLTRGARVLPADAFIGFLESHLQTGGQVPCPQLNQASRLVVSKDPLSKERLSNLLEEAC